MPVKVKCSNCDKALLVPDTARGKAVKCPQCQTRIPVPAEDDSDIDSVIEKAAVKPKAKAAKSSKPKPKEKKPLDSEAALATFDMRRAEDTEARICPKCGFDMKYQDEEDNECPQCGYDSSAGGMGAKAKKKAMRGPDPADFYPGLVKQSWSFVGRNQLLAWRTVMYTLICLAISLGCAFLYLYISMWPPRVFLALCCTISFLVVPGWMWFLDTEVIKLTLERKDKFKKLNFDFFLASAMGAAFVFWCIVVVAPLLALPAGLGYVLVNFGGMPGYVLPICLGLGAIPAIWMLPVVMSHMAMPVQYKGWMVWKLVPMWARNIKPLSYWLLWFLITNIPNIGGLVGIGAIYGPELGTMVQTMEFNANIRRQEFQRIQNPNTKKKGQVAPALEKLPDLKSVDFKPLIVPCVILLFMGLINGFTCMFNMRTNGQFTYYNKASLELVDKLKEYKYKAKEKRDEDEDEKPKTTVQHVVDSLVFFLVFGLLGLVGGMLYGAMTEAGTLKGIILGMLIGSNLALLTAWFNCVKAGFQDKPMWGFLNLFFHPFSSIVFACLDWQERQPYFFQTVFTYVVYVVVLICAIVFQALPMGDPSSGNTQSAPAIQQPMNPGQMAPGMQGQQGGMAGPPGGMSGPPGASHAPPVGAPAPK